MFGQKFLRFSTNGGLIETFHMDKILFINVDSFFFFV